MRINIYIYTYQTLYPPRNWQIPPWENANHRLKSAGDCRGIWDSSREKKKSRMTYAPPCCHPARSFPEIKMPTVIVIQLPMSAWSGIKGILSQQKANNKAWTKQASKNRMLSRFFSNDVWISHQTNKQVPPGVLNKNWHSLIKLNLPKTSWRH